MKATSVVIHSGHFGLYSLQVCNSTTPVQRHIILTSVLYKIDD